MLGAIKDIVILVATAVVVAHASGKLEWVWKQIAIIRRAATVKANENWGCPSIFNKSACHKFDSR